GIGPGNLGTYGSVFALQLPQIVYIGSDQTNYTFLGGVTYCVTNTFLISGTTTIHGAAVIKYAPGTTIAVETVDCETPSHYPAIFTSKNDGTVGCVPPDSTHVPSVYGDALDVENGNGSTTLQHLKISYAS